MKIKYRHSASKTNTFIDSPPFWIINELFDFESEPNARMVMGLAAEDAAHHALSNQINDEDTITNYAKTKYLEHSKDEVTDLLPTEHSDSEYEWSAIISNKFVKNLKEFGEVKSFQNEKQISGEKYGLKYDVIAKTDFEFDECIIDTKATAYIRRLKAGHVDPKWYPKPADVRQQCLYRDIFGKPTMLLYCSPKDEYCVDMVDRTDLNDIINAMKHIEHILEICKTKDDVVRIFPLICDNFRWKGSPGSEEFAKEIWTKVLK
jgi:uncharacterized protein YlbG (UPF0298 family)